MQLQKLPMLLLSSMFLLNSCTKKGDTGPAGPTGPSGPTFTGAISGHVFLYDQYGSRVYTGLSGIQVNLDNNVQSADANGFYQFGNVTTGSYNMTTSANGYGATRINNFQYLSDTLNRDIKMSAIPNFAPTAMTAYHATSLSADSLVLTFASDPRPRQFILFVGKTATVNNQVTNYTLVYAKQIPARATSVNYVVAAQDLYDGGFASGDVVYYAAYGYVIGDVSLYEDLATSKVVYNAVSATNVTANITAP